MKGKAWQGGRRGEEVEVCRGSYQGVQWKTKVVRGGDGKGEVLEEPVWEHLRFPKDTSEGPNSAGV